MLLTAAFLRLPVVNSRFQHWLQWVSGQPKLSRVQVYYYGYSGAQCSHSHAQHEWVTLLGAEKKAPGLEATALSMGSEVGSTCL